MPVRAALVLNERINVSLSLKVLTAFALYPRPGRGFTTDYDHRTQQYWQQRLTQEEMIGRYISHIPGKHFKTVRYYGFLSNRKGGLIAEDVCSPGDGSAEKPEQLGFATLMKGFLRTDPNKCILCGNRLRFSSAKADRHASELMAERPHNIDRKRWLLAQTAG